MPTRAFVRKKVRRYFMRTNSGMYTLLIIGIVLFLLGLMTIRSYYLKKISIFLLLVGAAIGGFAIYIIASSSDESVSEVDSAREKEIENLKTRAKEKLNLISDQTGLINDIVLWGPGSSPNSSMGLTVSDVTSKKNNIITSLFSLFASDVNYDPIDARKLGYDSVVRYMLIQVTVYSFTENQLLMYVGNVDTSTGLVYSEYTKEIFYSDISSISTGEQIAKLYSTLKKDFIYYSDQYIHLTGSGINLYANISSALDKSYIDKEFTGMRNLIREKKNAV